MRVMNRLSFLFAVGGALLSAAGLTDVHRVYMLPMSRSLDQYLANRLTNEHLFHVVTKPTKADAIFTDRIGEGFEQKLSELLTDPDAKPDAGSDAKKADEARQPEVRGDIGAETANKLAKPGSMSTLSHSRGTVFLVDAKTHQVIWSAYEPPRDSSSKQMDRTAALLVNRIKRELGMK